MSCTVAPGPRYQCQQLVDPVFLLATGHKSTLFRLAKRSGCANSRRSFSPNALNAPRVRRTNLRRWHRPSQPFVGRGIFLSFFLEFTRPWCPLRLRKVYRRFLRRLTSPAHDNAKSQAASKSAAARYSSPTGESQPHRDRVLAKDGWAQCVVISSARNPHR